MNHTHFSKQNICLATLENSIYTKYKTTNTNITASVGWRKFHPIVSKVLFHGLGKLMASQ